MVGYIWIVKILIICQDPEAGAVRHKDHEENGRDELFRILNALKVKGFLLLPPAGNFVICKYLPDRNLFLLGRKFYDVKRLCISIYY